MQEIKIRKIKFASFIKINLAIHISLGILVGVIGLVISFFSQNVYFNTGDLEITGVLAGIINLVFFPIVFSISSIFLSLLAYLPFKYWIKNVGLKVHSEYEVID